MIARLQTLLTLGIVFVTGMFILLAALDGREAGRRRVEGLRGESGARGERDEKRLDEGAVVHEP